ncbi:hypothetical protein GCM10023093_12570 [Nemorincola caseinilytica]|uniref:Uncharacterized protein n=2 Tax=Nemorincola caseinilytica TaxID=2054315 RepID=A0ABP8NCK1_9BACT
MILLATILSIRAAAQDVTYSRYDKFDYRNSSYAIVGMSGGLLYTYVKDEEAARLDAYDDSMNKVATVMLDFFPQRIYQVRFVAYPDKIMAIYQALESNKVVQYVAMLDAHGLMKGKPIELGSTKTSIFGATKNYFSSSVSENKKMILIYSATDKKSEIEFSGKWLDDNGNIVKQSKATFRTENMPEHGEVNVANDGTVYMAAYTPTGAQDHADQYWILALAPGATSFAAKEMELGEYFATGGYTRIDNVNNKVYFGGFYATSKNGRFAGFIYAAYDIATGTYTTRRFIPFDNELLTSAGEHRRGYSFDNYMVRQLIVKNDGGFVLVSEVQYITTRSSFAPSFGYYSFYSPAMSSSVREYHFNDIMALAYDKNGVREWSAFIPKQQYSQEDEGVFSSFALLNTGGTLAFLYNDFDSNHSRIQMSTLTPEGKTDTRGLSIEGTDYPDWLPRSAKQVSGRVLIVPCFHKKQLCFARVKF